MNNVGKIRKNSVLQHDSSDCGAACLVTVIKYFGGNSTIEKIRKLSGTSQYGTSMLGLYQAATQSGLEPTGYESSVKDIIEYSNVLILHINPEERQQHYIVSFGFVDDRFIIWDPAKGLTNMSKDGLEKIWLSKKCLGLLPASTFKLEKEKPMPLIFEEVKLECGYRIDILVDTKVVIEIKSVEALNDVHLALTLTYMKLGGYKLGLLINFNVSLLKDGLKRVVNRI